MLHCSSAQYATFHQATWYFRYKDNSVSECSTYCLAGLSSPMSSPVSISSCSGQRPCMMLKMSLTGNDHMNCQNFSLQNISFFLQRLCYNEWFTIDAGNGESLNAVVFFCWLHLLQVLLTEMLFWDNPQASVLTYTQTNNVWLWQKGAQIHTVKTVNAVSNIATFQLPCNNLLKD